MGLTCAEVVVEDETNGMVESLAEREELELLAGEGSVVDGDSEWLLMIEEGGAA